MVWRGQVRQREAWLGEVGMVWNVWAVYGMAACGKALFGLAGMAWRVPARHGTLWFGTAGKVRSGMTGLVQAMQGVAGMDAKERKE